LEESQGFMKEISQKASMEQDLQEADDSGNLLQYYKEHAEDLKLED